MGAVPGRFVMTVRLNSSGVANVTNRGGLSNDVAILTAIRRGSSSYVEGNIVCGVSGAYRYLADVVGGLGGFLGRSVARICINMKNESVEDLGGIVIGSLPNTSVVSRSVVGRLVSVGHGVACPSRRVLSTTARRCGVSGRCRVSPMNVRYDRLRNVFLGVL